MEDALQENILRLLEEIPGFEDYVWTGIPSPKLVVALMSQMSYEDEKVIIDMTEYGRRMKEHVKSYIRRCEIATKDLEERRAQIIHQSHKITMLDTMLNDAQAELKRLKSA